jgi:outer membrane protein W
VQYQFNERLTIGTHVTNPNFNRFDSEISATIPTVVEFGVSYEVSDKVLVNSGLTKSLQFDTDFRCGMEYSILSALFLRGGISMNPFRQFGGFGYQFRSIKVDAAASSHPQLGFSPQVAFSYEF